LNSGAPRWVFGWEYERDRRNANESIGLVVFGMIAVLALCIGVCALADAAIRVVA
jgi:hypothetical protein